MINPEYGPVEYGVEVRVDSSEQLDKLHAIEYLTTKIVEGGPEYDPEYLRYLRGLLEGAIRDLNDFLSDNAASFEDVMGAVDKARAQLDNDKGAEVERIMAEHNFPPILREVIESILVGRAERRLDVSIYRQLARTYHPDQTQIDPHDAEELFKLIGQFVWDENSRAFVF